MASLREIKDRIGSVRSTLKITNAMKLVASAKLRKAQQTIEGLHPYEATLASILAYVRAASPKAVADAKPESGSGKTAVVVVASNSSLCGGFNANVVKKALEVIDECEGEVDVFAIGRKAADALRRDGFPSPELLAGSGLNPEELVGHTDYDESTRFAQMLIDTLKTLGEYKIIDGGDPYWTSIPTKINLGGMFNINEYFSTGLHFHGEFERGLVKDGDEFKSKLTGFFTRTSLLGRANVKDWMEFIISASVLQSHGNWDWFNPGAGLTLTPFRTLQLYLFVDYISALPIVDAKQVNLTFGLNVLIARSNNK